MRSTRLRTTLEGYYRQIRDVIVSLLPAIVPDHVDGPGHELARPTLELMRGRSWSPALAIWIALACDTTEPSVMIAPECEDGVVARCEDDERDCVAQRRCDRGAWTRCSCASSSVGQECESDRDCGALERCFGTEAAYLGGTPVAGFCSMSCGDDPALCGRLDPPAVCVITDEGDPDDADDDAAYCLERCEVGASDGEKCRGRKEMVCAALGRDTKDGVAPLMRPMLDGPESERAGVCRSVCTSDDQCEEGGCDLRTGACGQRRAGAVLGTPCEVEQSSLECEGVCVELDGVALCSHRCRLGVADDCAPEGSNNPGLCRFPEATTGAVGDVGFCAELCDCDDECTHASLHCAAFGSATLESLTGRLGVCTPSSEDDADVGLACGDAGVR